MRPFETVRALIVDDNEDDAFLTKRMLEQIGFAPPFEVVTSGAEATLLLEKRPSAFDFVFLDIRMPQMDGFDVLRWIRAQATSGMMNVVMLTTSDDPRDVARARELGANGYLLKTTSAAKCAAILGGLLSASATS